MFIQCYFVSNWFQPKRRRTRGKAMPQAAEQVGKRYLEAAILDDTLQI